MKSIYTFIIVLCSFAVHNSFSQIPAWNWARSASGNEYDEASTVATDPLGNVYISGYYSSDSIIIGTVTLKNAGLSFNDIFLAKYDPQGNMIWAKRFGGSGNDRGISITTDKVGNVYLTGYFYSPSITFGTFTLTNASAVGDIFVVKFNSQGEALWATREGGTGLEIPHSILVDGNNNIIVAGRFSSNSITIGSTTLQLAGSMDVFIVKYDPSGNVAWAKGAGGGSNDEAYALSTDNVGNIYVAGYFTQPANFGTIKLTSAGISDMFLAKYDPSGNVLWAKRAGGKGDDRATALKTDPSGNSYITGYYSNDSISFGSVIIPDDVGSNTFIAKYNTDGDFQWAHGFGGDSQGLGLTEINGSVYVCGVFQADTLSYGSSNLPVVGSSDFYLLNCDANGNPKWVIKQTSGGQSSEFANAVTNDGTGNLYIAGTFKSSPIAFGTSSISNNKGFDIFLARLGSVATGITGPAESAGYQIFPNPVNDFLHIQLNTGKVKSIEILNMVGKMESISLKSEEGKDIEINTQKLKSGMYMLRIAYDDGIVTKKFVKE